MSRHHWKARKAAAKKSTAQKTSRKVASKMATRSTRNTGKPWTASEVKQMRQLAKQNTPTRVIGVKLGRSAGAVYQKASSEGISLKPTNQRPNKRK